MLANPAFGRGGLPSVGTAPQLADAQRENLSMTQTVLLNSLSPARRRLVEAIRELGFGRIEGLIVVGGEPIFEPPPRMVQELRFTRKDSERLWEAENNYALKSQVTEFLERLTSLGNGRIDLITVQNGLPFSLTLEQQLV